MLALLLAGLAQAAPPAFGVGVTGGLGFVDTASLDDGLEAYGFAPAGSPLLPHWGVRGQLRFESGLAVGAAMVSSFASRRVDASPVPTTTTWTRMGITLGYRPWPWLELGGQLGFASLVHSVGSDVQGGALTYLGPYLEPELRWVIVQAPQALQLALGGVLQLPVGPAHDQPLWEEPFDRRVVGGALLSITTGPGWTP